MLAGSWQLAFRHAVQGILAQPFLGKLRDPFPLQDSCILFVTAKPKVQNCRDAWELFAFMEGIAGRGLKIMMQTFGTQPSYFAPRRGLPRC
jgi:hypothetical protein